jgi:hypothetical protein
MRVTIASLAQRPDGAEMICIKHGPLHWITTEEVSRAAIDPD